MPATWTTEQILAMAPDARSAKAANGLATPRKWMSLGNNEQAIWGECQGSAKKPYQTQIDTDGPAFRCTCPSRKFPCKHALGLFLLMASQPTAFTQNTQPDWVTDWLTARTRSTQQRAKKKERAGKIADPDAQSKRAAERQKKVTAGLEELELRLHDVVRQGLAAAQGLPHSFWEEPAARMVDAQAPGVARLLREMRGIPSSGEGWPERLLEQLGRHSQEFGVAKMRRHGRRATARRAYCCCKSSDMTTLTALANSLLRHGQRKCLMTARHFCPLFKPG